MRRGLFRLVIAVTEMTMKERFVIMISDLIDMIYVIEAVIAVQHKPSSRIRGPFVFIPVFLKFRQTLLANDRIRASVVRNRG